MTTDDNPNDQSGFDAEAFLDKLRGDPEFRDEVREVLGQTPSSSRRALLKGAGTALGAGALVGGAGTAAADPQGKVGTSSNPVDQMYTDTLTMSGPNRDIQSAGKVTADNADLGGLSMSGDVDMGANAIKNMRAVSVSSTVTAGTVSAADAELGGLSMGGNDINDVGDISTTTFETLSNAETAGEMLMNDDLDMSNYNIDNANIFAWSLQMSGNIDMRGNDISNAGTVQAGTVDASSISFSGDLDMGGNNVVSAGTLEGSTGSLSGLSMNGGDVSNAGTVNATSIAATNVATSGLSMNEGDIISIGNIDMFTPSGGRGDINNAGTINADSVAAGNVVASGLSMAGDIDMTAGGIEPVNDIVEVGNIDTATISANTGTIDRIEVFDGNINTPAIAFDSAATGLFISGGDLYFASGGAFTRLTNL